MDCPPQRNLWSRGVPVDMLVLGHLVNVMHVQCAVVVAIAPIVELLKLDQVVLEEQLPQRSLPSLNNQACCYS